MAQQNGVGCVCDGLRNELPQGQARDVLAAPATAVMRHEGRAFVFVPDAGGFRRVDVDTGIESDDFIEVTEALGLAVSVALPLTEFVASAVFAVFRSQPAAWAVLGSPPPESIARTVTRRPSPTLNPRSPVVLLRPLLAGIGGPKYSLVFDCLSSSYGRT